MSSKAIGNEEFCFTVKLQGVCAVQRYFPVL